MEISGSVRYFYVFVRLDYLFLYSNSLRIDAACIVLYWIVWVFFSYQLVGIRVVISGYRHA